MVVGGDLKNRYYYLLAKSGGWRFEDENFGFCTTSRAFAITGDANCAGPGYDVGKFRKIDTGTTGASFTVDLAAFVRPEPPKAEAPAGTFGETYSSGTAIFQDCVSETEAPFCSFHADGTRFFVYDDGRTPSLVMRSLRGYLPGTPIEVSGDLESIHDRTADVVLRRVLPRQWSRADSVLDRMQGQWYAVEDPNATFTVLGSERENVYDGAYTGLDCLTIGNRCDSFDSGEYLIAADEESGEIYCYGIEELGNRSMTLIYLPNGNFLEYRKLD